MCPCSSRWSRHDFEKQDETKNNDQHESTSLYFLGLPALFYSLPRPICSYAAGNLILLKMNNTPSSISPIVIQGNPSYDCDEEGSLGSSSNPEQQIQQRQLQCSPTYQGQQQADIGLGNYISADFQEEEREQEDAGDHCLDNQNESAKVKNGLAEMQPLDWDEERFPFPKEAIKRIVVPRLSVSSPCGTTRNDLLALASKKSGNGTTTESILRRSSSPATMGPHCKLGARPKVRRATMGVITRVSPAAAAGDDGGDEDNFEDGEEGGQDDSEFVSVAEEALLSVYGDEDGEDSIRRTSDVSLYQQQKRVRLSIPCEPCISSSSVSSSSNNLTVPGEVIGGVRAENGEMLWANPDTRSQIFKRRSAVHGLSPNSGLSIGAVM